MVSFQQMSIKNAFFFTHIELLALNTCWVVPEVILSGDEMVGDIIGLTAYKYKTKFVLNVLMDILGINKENVN